MRILLAGAVLLLAVTLARCGGSDDPDPTAIPQTTATQVVAGNLATDGICQATIPDDWVDGGTGRGATLEGDRWIVFGGAIASDDAWNKAVELVKTQVGTEGADVQQTETSVTITQAAGRGYVHRERFNTQYCEFSVTTTADRSPEVIATWQQAATTLQPKESE